LGVPELVTLCAEYDLRRLIVDRLRRLLGADRSAMFTWDDATGALVAAAAAPEEPAISPLPDGSGALGVAFEQQGPIVLDDYASAPFRWPSHSAFARSPRSR
jgi:GAF domain-containing protein